MTKDNLFQEYDGDDSDTDSGDDESLRKEENRSQAWGDLHRVSTHLERKSSISPKF